MTIFSKTLAKVDQIRRQPEHIRLRWVWGSVAISMFFILAIWIFSIGSLFQGDGTVANQNSSTAPALSQQLKDLKEQAPSIKDFTDQQLTSTSEGINNPANETEFQYPGTENAPAAPQTSAYSELPTGESAQ